MCKIVHMEITYLLLSNHFNIILKMTNRSFNALKANSNNIKKRKSDPKEKVVNSGLALVISQMVGRYVKYSPLRQVLAAHEGLLMR